MNKYVHIRDDRTIKNSEHNTRKAGFNKMGGIKNVIAENIVLAKAYCFMLMSVIDGKQNKGHFLRAERDDGVTHTCTCFNVLYFLKLN